MRQSEHFSEAIVVGGGLAGASAACVLARAGRPVLVIERETKPCHKVCGEFLGIEAQTYLARLGIDLNGLDASRISSVRLVHGTRVAEARLPFEARGLSRLVLDEALLTQAVSNGARLAQGVTVRRLLSDGSRLRVDTGSHTLETHALFLANGKHDLRGARREAAGTRNDLIGFKSHYRLASTQRAALEGAVEIILFSGGYAGLQMIEGETANLCLLVTRGRFEQVGRSWGGLLARICEECPHLAARLDGAAATFDRPLSIFRVPYGFIHRPQAAAPTGLFRLGDQAVVIPSFTGDGMSIALHSGWLAAAACLSGRDGAAFQEQLAHDIRRQIQISSLLYEIGRRPSGQRALVGLSRAWPMAMRHIASFTRIREAALRRALDAP